MSERTKRIKNMLKHSTTLPMGAGGAQSGGWMMGSAAHGHSQDHSHHHHHHADGSCCGHDDSHDHDHRHHDHEHKADGSCCDHDHDEDDVTNPSGGCC